VGREQVGEAAVADVGEALVVPRVAEDEGLAEVRLEVALEPHHVELEAGEEAEEGRGVLLAPRVNAEAGRTDEGRLDRVLVLPHVGLGEVVVGGDVGGDEDDRQRRAAVVGDDVPVAVNSDEEVVDRGAPLDRGEVPGLVAASGGEVKDRRA
jgi:hypothetical protein